MSPDPKAARTEVDALAAEVAAVGSELTGLQELHRKHDAAATKAAREHRAGKLDADALQAATSAAAAVKYAVDATRADLLAAREALEAAERTAADEVILAEIAAATVAYHEAERAHHEMFVQTERAIAAAIAKSDELMRAASAAKTRAKDAAVKLATKRTTDVEDVLERAVIGSEVPPMKSDARISKWPTGNRQTYRLLAQLKPKTQGVTFGEGDGA